jgi:hypothetical protein
MRNFTDMLWKENQNIHFWLLNILKNHTSFEKMWKNIVERDRKQMNIWGMPIPCSVFKATNTQTQGM